VEDWISVRTALVAGMPIARAQDDVRTEDQTFSSSEVKATEPEPVSGPEPALVLALECARPLGGPTRFELADIDHVVIGRGPTLTGRPLPGAGLRIEVPDGWLSSRHARLVREGRAWRLRDQGSKNGCFVDGRPVAEARLVGGELLELGGCMFHLLARGAAPAEAFEPGAHEAGALATLCPDLAARFRQLRRVARSTVPVLLAGETGVGKELVARAVHALSGRPGPIIAVNCGALPDGLVESELFGCKRGAFSGAETERVGLVRAADGGTLLLDEIAELPPRAQVTLLRVLQEREVLPVGASRGVPVDLRVVAATHRDLAALVAGGAFRRDLYGRLVGFSLTVPPLRERRVDLGLLVGRILRRLVDERRARVLLSRSAARALWSYAWPGNVRELEQALAAALALTDDGVISVEHLPEPLRVEAPPPAPLGDQDAALRQELVAALTRHRGNVSAVARQLGKARVQIHRWCRRLGIRITTFR
jgi:sigma-54 dependent transcriptional regulator, acetoin dehydrogenase operon transcriptional activator AcoR